MSSSDLDSLLTQARSGDAEALGALYDRYKDAIYRYLYRRCGDAELAEDLTGSTFLRILEAINSDRPWSTSFSGWLYRIAHNLLTDHLRARGRHPQTELSDTFPADTGGLEDYVGRRLDAAELRATLNELKPEYAEVLLLRFAEGLSHAATGDVLGKTEGAVKVMQHRALKALRRQIELRRVGGSALRGEV